MTAHYPNHIVGNDCVNSLSQISFSARWPAVTRPAFEIVNYLIPINVPYSCSVFLPSWSPLHIATLHRSASRHCFPSGNAPIALVRRLISRLTLSSMLFVRIRIQCWLGKSIKVRVSSMLSSTFCTALPSFISRSSSATCRAYSLAAFLLSWA